MAIPAFDHHAREIGFQVVARSDGLLRHLSIGDLELGSTGEQTRIRVTAQDMPPLQMLRDDLTGELAQAGITPERQGQRATGRPANHALARVGSSVRPSPTCRHVAVQGADLARFAAGGLQFRLLFGQMAPAGP